MSRGNPSKAANPEAIRVLQIIKRTNGIARQQLAANLECSLSKISQLLLELETEGLVAEGESVDVGTGRRVKRIVINGSPAQFVGAELGSSEMRVVLADFGGNVLARTKIPENINVDDPNYVLGRLFSVVDEFVSSNPGVATNVKGLALALSGVVDFKEGTAKYYHNQKVWQGVPMRKLVESRYGLPCIMDDSSRAMAAAEKKWGCCRNNDDFVVLSLGIGLGAGVFINGGIYRGARYASEIGHMIIDPDGPRCNCGSHGCLESFVSGYALENRIHRAIEQGVRTSLGGLKAVTAKDIVDAARDGDKLAFGAVSEMAAKLGVGIANVINIFHPERVVLSGGLSNAGELLMAPIRQIVRSTALSTHTEDCGIDISPLDEYSAAMGMTDMMAGWALQSAERIIAVTGISI